MPERILPKDFFSENPPQRIVATETECNPQVAEGATGMSGYINQEAAKKAGYKCVPSGNWVGVFMENGFGLYVDVGHLEISTPECLGPRQGAAADKAGILLLAQIVEASDIPHNGIHRHSGTIIGNTERTSGHHQNFQIPRSISHNKLLDSIVASHLSSDAWSMAGAIKKGFQLSQKVKGIADPPITRRVERRTEKNNKPMAMIPPTEADKDTIGMSGWARFERRYADAGFAPTGRYLGLAATSLALRLVEHADKLDLEKLKAKSFKGFAYAAKLFNEDLSFKAVAPTVDGGMISAINYQELLGEAFAQLNEKVKLPEDESQAIPLLFRVYDGIKEADFANGHYGQLTGMIDLPARHRYLTTRFPGDELNSNNRKAVEANLTWDRIQHPDPEKSKGGAMTFWDKVPSPYISHQEIEDLLTKPPRTRAAVRGGLIADPNFEAVSAKWVSVSSEKHGTVFLDDPYETGFY